MYGIYVAVGRLISLFISPISKPLLRKTKRVYAMIVVGDEVLMVKNWLGRNEWRLPGGGVGRSESPDAALRRELHEELKMSLPKDAFSAIEPIVVKDEIGFYYHCYKVALKVKPSVLRNKHEIVDAAWLSAEQAQKELANRDRSLSDYLLQ